MKLNECINLLMSKARKSVNQNFASKLDSLDITPVQYGVWKCLWENGTMTPSQIAQELSIDTSTITGLLDRLESKGLLKRAPNPNDRRAIQISLTETGLELETPIEKLAGEAHNEVMSVFSKEEQQQFISYLWRMLDNLSGATE